MILLFEKVTYECIEVHFSPSHTDRFRQNTLTSCRRKMYLIALMYFKDFQMLHGAKSQWGLNVRSVPLPLKLMYIFHLIVIS